MITDRELWACANLLITQHKAGARGQAERRATELLANGQHDGHRIFCLIAERIKALEQPTPVGPRH